MVININSLGFMIDVRDVVVLHGVDRYVGSLSDDEVETVLDAIEAQGSDEVLKFAEQTGGTHFDDKRDYAASYLEAHATLRGTPFSVGP